MTLTVSWDSLATKTNRPSLDRPTSIALELFGTVPKMAPGSPAIAFRTSTNWTPAGLVRAPFGRTAASRYLPSRVKTNPKGSPSVARNRTRLAEDCFCFSTAMPLCWPDVETNTYFPLRVVVTAKTEPGKWISCLRGLMVSAPVVFVS